MMDKPIIFNTTMVQALLAGRKTQTRRVVKAKSHVEGVTNKQSVIVARKFQQVVKAGRWYGYDDYDHSITCYADCPYGQPGDLLWVREAMQVDGYLDTYYIADTTPADIIGDHWYYRSPEYVGKTPSRCMPRRYSRLTLLVKDIRIERVQDISADDAIAEGIERSNWKYSCEPYRNYEQPKMAPGRNCSTAQRSFQTLWDSINEQRGYGWAINPWIWRVEFDVIPHNIDQVIKTQQSLDQVKNLELAP